MMGLLWFWLVAVMIVGYVVLDGFDLGVGVLHLFLVRTEQERQVSLRPSGRCGTAMRSGCLPEAARFTSRFHCSMPRPSRVSICRS